MILRGDDPLVTLFTLETAGGSKPVRSPLRLASLAVYFAVDTYSRVLYCRVDLPHGE